MSRASFAMVLLMLLAPALALAQTAPAFGQVRALLRRPHDGPSADELRAVSADPTAALLAIALDPGGWGIERLRATALLAERPEPKVLAGLEQLARHDGLASVRRTALASLAHGPAHPALLEKVAIAALADADPHVRLEAVHALASPSRASRAALATALQREQVDFVKQALVQTR